MSTLRDDDLADVLACLAPDGELVVGMLVELAASPTGDARVLPAIEALLGDVRVVTPWVTPIQFATLGTLAAMALIREREAAGIIELSQPTAPLPLTIAALSTLAQQAGLSGVAWGDPSVLAERLLAVGAWPVGDPRSMG